VAKRFKIRRKREESGVALLLAIFVLLLVAVVGIAMMAASGTETSLASNYRSSTAAYYAAMSGLEEARGRLLPKNANYLGNLSPPAIPPIGTSLPLGSAIYITNPLPGETVDPTNLGNPATFPDTEWATEFPNFNPASSVRIVNSVASFGGEPNALYKWVRINAVDELALLVDVNNSNPGDYSALNKFQIVRFDGTNLTRGPASYQALGITALAALPDGSRKLLQYVVGPITLQIPVTSALTLSGPGTTGNVAAFNPPANATSFYVNGSDQCSVKLPIPAVGVTNDDDYTSVNGSLSTPSPNANHYTGAGGYIPNVTQSPYPVPANPTVNMTDPISLSNFLPIVQNAADVVLNGPRTEADMPSAMSPSNPMTVYVNGDLSLTSFNNGYGLLVVRGNLTYTGDSGWKGIVIVLGGTMQEVGSLDGGEFDGAVYVLDLITTAGGGASLGLPTYIVSHPGGAGIHYNSCWVTTAQKPISYKVLAFREIPYP